MTLLVKQQLFTRYLTMLLRSLHDLGYDVTLGEAWRPDVTAEYYAREGRGIAKSNHRLRIAIDLNLFREGQYLTKTDDYRAAGELWEALSADDIKCVWGGRFAREDAFHFSFEHEGIQ